MKKLIWLLIIVVIAVVVTYMSANKAQSPTGELLDTVESGVEAAVDAVTDEEDESEGEDGEMEDKEMDKEDSESEDDASDEEDESEDESEGEDGEMEDKEMDKEDSESTAGTYAPYSADAVANATGTVILSFSAEWCPACQDLKKDIKASMDDIPGDVTILEVDYDEYEDLKEKYEVTGQHTQVVVDSEGNLIKKWRGGETLEDVLGQLGA